MGGGGACHGSVGRIRPVEMARYPSPNSCESRGRFMPTMVAMQRATTRRGVLVALALACASCSEPSDVEFAESSSEALLTGAVGLLGACLIVLGLVWVALRVRSLQRPALRNLVGIGVGLVTVLPVAVGLIAAVIALVGSKDILDLLGRTDDGEARSIAVRGLVMGWAVLGATLVVAISLARRLKPRAATRDRPSAPRTAPEETRARESALAPAPAPERRNRPLRAERSAGS